MTSKRLAAAVAGVVVAVGAAIVLLAVSEPEEADEETIALAQAALNELGPRAWTCRVAPASA